MKKRFVLKSRRSNVKIERICQDTPFLRRALITEYRRLVREEESRLLAPEEVQVLAYEYENAA